MITGIYSLREVYVNGIFLNPIISQQVKNHSPDGFAWGYGGSGPAQLSLAILLLYTTKEYAVVWYQDFKWDIIAKLPQQNFELEESIVKNWIEKKEKENV